MPHNEKSRHALAIATRVLLAALLVLGCKTLDKIDWPRKLACVPSTPDILNIVGAALAKNGDWKTELEELAFDHEAGAVLCAVKQIVDDLATEAAATQDVRVNLARGELFLAESGTEFE